MPRHCSPENSVKEWAGFGGIRFGTFYPNSSRSCRSSRGIPNELDKAAELDGSSQLGIVLRIIRPLIRPALITTTLLSFSWTWEDFLTPLVYLNEPTLDTISVAFRSSADPSSAPDGGAIFARSALSLVPVLVVCVAFPRHLVTCGLKG